MLSQVLLAASGLAEFYKYFDQARPPRSDKECSSLLILPADISMVSLLTHGWLLRQHSLIRKQFARQATPCSTL